MTAQSRIKKPKTAKPVSTPMGTVASIRGRVFDARPDRLDFRDLPYRPPLRSLPPRFPADLFIKQFLPSYVKAGLVLNQGTQGACTGFGLACVANYLLWVRHHANNSREAFESVSPQMLYQLARRYDEWPGQDYEGSSCRGALKGWHKHGVCSARFWPYKLRHTGEPVFVPPKKGWDRDAGRRTIGVYYRVKKESVVDLQAAIAEIGAVYASAQAHDGWDMLLQAKQPLPPPKSHDELPAIPPVTDRKSMGGHAFALVGFNERGFIVQNSWGEKWGASGFALLPYEDWIEHATDAWACALGVPANPALIDQVSSSWPLPSGRSLLSLDRSARASGNPPGDPWPIDHEFANENYRPWPTDSAYRHTLVTGNDGEIIVSDFTCDPRDREAYAKRIVHDAPRAWAMAQPKGPIKLAIYAHGGLNSEHDSISRIRVMAPYFKANNIYPLFLTWETGAGETISHMVDDWLKRIGGGEAGLAGGLLDTIKEKIDQTRDRAFEAVAHVLGRGIWSEMRENASHSMRPGRGLDLLARNLAALNESLAQQQRSLELHMLGHSAGSILLGHLLERAMKPDLKAASPKIHTCTLFAAACSMRFAVERYVAAADKKLLDLERLWLYYLSDNNEKRDGLPSPRLAAYGKSLLYLVSRALDDERKMPLLGMERAVQPGYENDSDQWEASELPFIQTWQSRWKPQVANETLARSVTTPSIQNTKAGGQIQATHGSFDNNIPVLRETIERIKGAPLVSEIEWLDF